MVGVCRIGYCDNPIKVEQVQLCSPHYQQQHSGRPFTVPRVSSLMRNEDGLKRCRTCREWQAEDQFGVATKSLDGLSTYCRPCIRKRQRATLERNRDRSRAKRFNMSRAEFDALLESQGGRCAICQTDSPGPYHYWCVDHDHRCCPERAMSCGACVRGILCPACNKGIGLLGDDVETIRRAADYLSLRSQPIAPAQCA